MHNRGPRNAAQARARGRRRGVRHGHRRGVRASAGDPGHARGNDTSPERTGRHIPGRNQGGADIAREALVDQTRLLQEGGVRVGQVGSLGSCWQHQQLGDEAADPLRGGSVAARTAGRGRASLFSRARRVRAPRGGQRVSVLAEAAVLVLLSQCEEAPGGVHRGMSVHERRFDRHLLGQELIEQASEAAKLAPALVRKALGAQDKRERLRRLRGQRPPQLLNAATEEHLPAEDDVVLRQAPEGIKPLLELAKGGVGWRSHRGAGTSFASTVIITVRELTGRCPGVRLFLVAHRVIVDRRRRRLRHRGRSLRKAEGRSLIPGEGD